MNMDEKFRKHLLETFQVEADEHLKSITFNLIELEKTEEPEKREELIEVIFRETHSLKGASRAVDQNDIEVLCQAMENVLSVIKKKELAPTVEHFDLFQEIGDFIGQILAHMDLELTIQEKEKKQYFIKQLDIAKESAIHLDETKELVNSRVFDAEIVMEDGQENTSPAKGEIEPVDMGQISPEPLITAAIIQEQVRVSASRLSAVLLQSEEMLSAKLAASQRTLDMKIANGAFEVWKKEWAKILPVTQMIKANPAMIAYEDLANNRINKQHSVEKIIEFLEWNTGFMNELQDQYGAVKKLAERDSLILDSMVDNLLDDMKKVMMFPFLSIFELFPKVVRDLARDNGKKVDIELKGGEIEIDRRILEEIKDPFLHLIRNCVDHGIEKPEERKQKNKPERGKITIEVFPKNQMVEIIISDDGAGIDPEKVRAAALKSNTQSKSKIENITDQEILSYVYKSGVSTSPIITEFSGHGLGLAIVREKVDKLGGTISFKSQYGVGTCFHVIIPLTIATFSGILVKTCERIFVIPTMYVERAVRIKLKEIETIENRDTIIINNAVVPLVSLSNMLEFSGEESRVSQSEYVQAIVLNDGGTHLAVSVDEILNEQEVLFKSLGKLLSHVNNVAGATVLGTGVAVPIINVSDLVKSAVKSSMISGILTPLSDIQEKINLRPLVLVAEDSITTRTLLKNILETADFDVDTAVDGLAAFALLKSKTYDAVVSDVEMPRMNGFELTAKIRNDNILKEIPIILVTALESREDKERGIDVGADAYIIKSSFDQSNLLEALNRLIHLEE